MLYLEPWNPFDTSDKVCFPDVTEALSPGYTLEHAVDVVDIDVLSRCAPIDIDGSSPPQLGHLPVYLSQLLQDKCQAWFNEQRRLKAARGDSPTPSCSFRLPGIPYVDTAEAILWGAQSLQAITATAGSAQQPSAPDSIAAPVADDASSALSGGGAVLQHTAAPQHSARRHSFAFQSPSRLAAASPTYPFRPPAQSSAPAQHQESAAVGHSPAAATAGPPAASSPVTEQQSTTGAGHAASRLSWLMQQNLQQLQALLQDQRQEYPVPKDQLQQQQALLDQHVGHVHPEHEQQQQQQQQQQDAASLQSRLSLVLQQNQIQLQQLLHHRQQQQQQSQPEQPWQGTSEQEQQHDQGAVVQQRASLEQLEHRQQVQQELTFHPKQYGSAYSDSRYLPGSPERAAAAVAAAAAAATRAKQRVATVAAAAADGPSGASPGHAGAGGFLTPSVAATWSAAASSPAGTGLAARRQLTRHQAAAPAAVSLSAASVWTEVINRSIPLPANSTSGSSSSATHGTNSSRLPQAAVAATAASTVQRLSAMRYAAGAAATQKLPSWHGLQAMQQHRWQQRLHAPAAAIAAATGTPARSPVRDMETQTASPPKDESVQTEGAAAPAASAAVPSTGGAEALLEAIAAVGRLHQSSSPAGTPAMPPVAVAAALAVVAAVTATAAVATAGSPQLPAAASAPAGTLSPAVMAAAAAAAAAAAVAASTGDATCAAVSPPPPQQQQASRSTASVGRHVHTAIPHSHVVRSLFASNQPMTPAVPPAVAVRHIPVTSSTHLGDFTRSVGDTPGRSRVQPVSATHGHQQQEQVHAGPADGRQQHCQHQRPLPWPDPPGVDRPFLSPMKAYQGSSSGKAIGGSRKSMQFEGGGVGLSAGAATVRMPLGEATNSPGTTGTASPGLRQLSAAPDSEARAAQASAFHAAAGLDVSSSVTGVFTCAVDSANTIAAIPAAAPMPALMPAAPIVSYGSPALQRLWSGYKAGWFRSVPTTPVAWHHSAHGQADTVGAPPTAPRVGTTLQSAGMHRTTSTGGPVCMLGQQYMAGNQVEGTSDDATAAAIAAVTAAAAGRSNCAAPGSAVSPGSDAAAVAAVLAASSGPASIDPRFYPPSLRRLLAEMPLPRRGVPAGLAAAEPGRADAIEGVAELAQQQLRVLLEQQLASMTLSQRPLVPAAAAAANLHGQQLAGARLHVVGAKDTTADGGGSSVDQLGAEADVDTTSSSALHDEAASERAGARSEHSRNHPTGEGSGPDAEAVATPAVVQQESQQETTVIPTAAPKNIAKHSHNRIARFVAAYQQQLMLGSQQQQQHIAFDAAVGGTVEIAAADRRGGGTWGVSGSSGWDTSVRGASRSPAAIESGCLHAAAGQGASVLPEMMQRFLQE